MQIDITLEREDGKRESLPISPEVAKLVIEALSDGISDCAKRYEIHEEIENQAYDLVYILREFVDQQGLVHPLQECADALDFDPTKTLDEPLAKEAREAILIAGAS
jgi:hypothetical protein